MCLYPTSWKIEAMHICCRGLQVARCNAAAAGGSTHLAELNSPTRCSMRHHNCCTLIILFFLWYWEAQIVIEIQIIARPYRRSTRAPGIVFSPADMNQRKVNQFTLEYTSPNTITGNTHTQSAVSAHAPRVGGFLPLFTLRPGNEPHLSIITVRGLRWPGLRPLWNWSGIMAISSAHCVPVTMEAVDVMDNFGRKEDLISQMNHGKTSS